MPSAAAALLITMPHSHYAEKARWALDRLGLPYREARHVPLLHRVATMRRGGASVPLLLHGGARLTDSTDIVAHVDAACGGGLLPADPRDREAAAALEDRFDRVLGVHARRWAYAQLLPDRTALRRMMSQGVPRHEAALLPLLMPAIVPLVRRAFRITPETAERSRQRVREEFAAVDALLADGRRYLVGDRFSVADLGFAALASPVLLPPQCGAPYPSVDEVPAAMRDEVLHLRATVAGRFALRLYADERAARPAAAALGFSSSGP
jgi:glutathione S-transferase